MLTGRQVLYFFHRAVSPQLELKTWEAYVLWKVYGAVELTSLRARATSAAPTYFSAFKHDSSNQVYLDGGIYHNNPIKLADAERKAIWSEDKDTHPDIFLSIGTGFGQKEIAAQYNHPAVLSRGMLGYFKTMYSIASDHIATGLGCERAWKEWIETKEPHSKYRTRYHRLNVPLDFEPEMDNVEDLEKYRDLARKEMVRQKGSVLNIADLLIASCFFFRFAKEDLVQDRGGRLSCKGRTVPSLLVINGLPLLGTIECRFLPGDSNTKLLGEHLSDLARQAARVGGLYFIVKETHEKLRPSNPRVIEENVLERMTKSGIFDIGPIKVMISSEPAETEILICLGRNSDRLTPISGFPRQLHKDYPGTRAPPPAIFYKN